MEINLICTSIFNEILIKRQQEFKKYIMLMHDVLINFSVSYFRNKISNLIIKKFIFLYKCELVLVKVFFRDE